MNRVMGNGKWEGAAFLLSAIKKGDWLVACDGALQKAVKLGLSPDVIIGDFGVNAMKKLEDADSIVEADIDAETVLLKGVLFRAGQAWISPFRGSSPVTSLIRTN